MKYILAEETPSEDKQSAVFITTFESVIEDNKTVIKAKNKKLTKKDNFVVEEVLSEEDEPEKHKPTESGTVTIEEVLEDDIIDYGKLLVQTNILYIFVKFQAIYDFG